jgi:hypothetical protein
MIRTALIALTLTLGAAPAFATGTAFTATLEAPVAERTRIVADGAVWVCQDASCSALLNRSTPTVRACKQLVRETGRLTAYSNGTLSLTSDEVAECNTRAR